MSNYNVLDIYRYVIKTLYYVNDSLSETRFYLTSEFDTCCKILEGVDVAPIDKYVHLSLHTTWNVEDSTRIFNNLLLTDFDFAFVTFPRIRVGISGSPQAMYIDLSLPTEQEQVYRHFASVVIFGSKIKTNIFAISVIVRSLSIPEADRMYFVLGCLAKYSIPRDVGKMILKHIPDTCEIGKHTIRLDCRYFILKAIPSFKTIKRRKT